MLKILMEIINFLLKKKNSTVQNVPPSVEIVSVRNDQMVKVMNVKMDELLKGKKLEDQPSDVRDNLKILLEKMNKIRDAYGKPMIVTSGLRTMDDHLAIYARKGITDKSKIPMKSHHLFGRACDVSDPKKELQEWCKVNESFLKDLGIFMESFDITTNWVHFQIVPYGSYKEGGSLWFNP